MLFLKATDKYKEFKNFNDYIRLFGFILVIFFFTALSWFLYQNIIITLTLTISSLVFFYIIAIPPKKIEVIIYGDKIKIDGSEYLYNKFVFWGVSELEEKLEIVLQKKSINADTVYFYIDKGSNDLEKIVSVVSQSIPYNEEVVYQNKVHLALRYFGLR